MAPAADSNWLNFSLSSMEMLASPHQLLSSSAPPPPPNHATTTTAATTSLNYHHQPPPPPPSHHFLLDGFYPNEWIESKAATDEMYESEQGHDEAVRGSGMISNSGYLPQHGQTVPKLEDFLGGDANTQDSSTLTHIYDPSPAYFNDISLPPAPVSAAAFQAFSTNSGSEVDDSQIACAEFVGQAIDSQFPNNSGGGTLSLSVPRSKEIVPAPAPARPESDGAKKVADTFGQRTSIYRGVTRHRWTGRYEAHLWDNSCRREGQARKGRQVYLGGYDKEDKAARAYDLAALKYWGPSATTNFPITTYSKEIEEMKNMTKQEFIASLRRKSSGFSRGASIYRGVTRHHQQGRWQARIGRVAGNKDLYLGTFATEEEAAEAYDIAAIKFRGVNAVTNFEMNRYDVEAILKSALPVGGAAKRLKVSSDEQKPMLSLEYHHQPQEEQQLQLHQGGSSSINFGSAVHQQQQQQQSLPYALPLDAAAASYYQQQQQGYFQHLQSANALPSETPMGFLPPPSEFYLWPHQPY